MSKQQGKTTKSRGDNVIQKGSGTEGRAMKANETQEKGGKTRNRM